jgi:hypothetical protein
VSIELEKKKRASERASDCFSFSSIQKSDLLLFFDLDLLLFSLSLSQRLSFQNPKEKQTCFFTFIPSPLSPESIACVLGGATEDGAADAAAEAALETAAPLRLASSLVPSSASCSSPPPPLLPRPRPLPDEL